MTALCQFAYVTPLHKVMHWDDVNKRRTICYQGKYEKCTTCEKGNPQVHDYTYGVFTEKGSKRIPVSYTHLTLPTKA